MERADLDRVANEFPGELPAEMHDGRMALLTNFGRHDGLLGFQIPGGEKRWHSIDQVTHLAGGALKVTGAPREIHFRDGTYWAADDAVKAG